MNAVDTEKMIDVFLVHINNALEEKGVSINTARFDFNEGSSNFKNLCADQGWTVEDVNRILNICRSRKLIDKKTCGRGNHALVLTSRGQGRAISTMNGQKNNISGSQQMNIENITVNGLAQVGNGNVQNIESIFYNLIEQINNSTASKAEKDEAKGLLKQFIEHPLICAVVGGATGGLMGLLK